MGNAYNTPAMVGQWEPSETWSERKVKEQQTEKRIVFGAPAKKRAIKSMLVIRLPEGSVQGVKRSTKN